jgi:internalin A
MLEAKVRSKLTTVQKGQWGLLELRNCGLTEIPSEIFKMDYLTVIDFSNDDFCEERYRNKIKIIPDEIEQLKSLFRLDISGNLVSHISENLSNIKTLEYLNLRNNRLTDFSAKIANLPKLKQLLLDGNPFEMIPPEIVARGIDSLRNFFIELEEKDFLYEAKLIIVGEGRVGKTCISKALIDPGFKLTDEESTEGININRWIIPKDEIQLVNPKIHRDLQINVWDFGGQEIYHSTHQFFLTKRSMYMLVTESRKEDSHDDFYYWLNIIKLLGDKSPVVLVLNKSDQPTKDLPVKEFSMTFNNIVDFQKISLKSGYEESLIKLKNTLKQIASNLPHIGNPLPKKWVNIRIELEQLKLAGKNFISEAQYLEICKNHYRKTESALFLSEYFHDLGVLLHFQDDIDLKDTVILNHEWLTTGVYKILDDQKVIDQKGRFTLEDLKRIWSDEEYKQKIRELLTLMKNKKFDLCFDLSHGEYLIPRLLPVDEIEHSWINDIDNLKFEIHYKFMPKGILTRLIVKMNQDIYNNEYWRYGVLLQYLGTKAIIREKYFENKISIELLGQHKREFLFLIRKTINEIHRDFNKLKFEEMVPCDCSQCKSSTEPYFYEFDLLLRYEMKGLSKIICDNSLEEVAVAQLTTDVIKGRLSEEKMVLCENMNEVLLKESNIQNVVFCAEKDNSSVFFQVKTRPQFYGLRDRDFLLDSEINKIKQAYPNYFILDYYCFENYLYHPENIAELKLEGFDKKLYIQELVTQKNKKKLEIISIFKKSRDSYQEFKIEREKLKSKNEENDIIKYLESDDIETFFKAFSVKDYFDRSSIGKYNLKPVELVRTKWFAEKMDKIFNG